VAWASQVQPTVASSTTAAEYMAGAAASREGLWYMTLWSKLGMGASAHCCDVRQSICTSIVE
jgi:hypothetical protein